jgi:hypothetical protein
MTLRYCGDDVLGHVKGAEKGYERGGDRSEPRGGAKLEFRVLLPIDLPSGLIQLWPTNVFQYGSPRKEKNSDDSESNLDKRRHGIRFAELQRMRTRQLQCQLVQKVITMRADGSDRPVGR